LHESNEKLDKHDKSDYAQIRHIKLFVELPMVQQRIILPFRNIRDVLGLHAKVSSQKPFLISINREQRRQIVSFVEFTGRVHQVANLLYDDLQIQRGDSVAIVGASNVYNAVIMMACWVIGAVVVPLAPDSEPATVTSILHQSKTKLVFAGHDALKTLHHAIKAANVIGIVQLDGETREGMLNFEEVVANRPTTFLGDDSGAKGADIPLKAGDERTAKLDDAALWLSTDTVLTQYQLLLTANSLAQAQAVTGNQHMIGILPLHRVESLVANLILPMVVGATVILIETFTAKAFWELVVNEKANIALVDTDSLRGLLDFANANQQTGDTIFGQGIDRRQMKHFRHFLALHYGLNMELVRDVEAMLGLPIISSYGVPHTAGFATVLPITLSWDDHQLLLHGLANLCVGCAIAGCELAIDTSNWGETVPLVVNGQATGDMGYYQQGDDGRAYFFIVNN
jgi:acyl-coenzyme A synthetase/AMP-(fatty) acid ligase